MPTNKEWLYSLDPHELTEWFDAEHVENQNDTLDGARAALDDENDSREKLEADVNQYVMQQVNSTITWEVANEIKDVIIALLDRQAAITERDCDYGLTEKHDRIIELQAKVDKLTEQRDRWRENWNRRNVEYSDLVNEYEELRDEKTNLESTLDVILDALADYWLPDER